MTNVYILQKGDANFRNTIKKELEVFFGLHITMGVIKFPRLRLYWDKYLDVAFLLAQYLETVFSGLEVIKNENDNEQAIKTTPPQQEVTESEFLGGEKGVWTKCVIPT